MAESQAALSSLQGLSAQNALTSLSSVNGASASSSAVSSAGTAAQSMGANFQSAVAASQTKAAQAAAVKQAAVDVVSIASNKNFLSDLDGDNGPSAQNAAREELVGTISSICVATGVLAPIGVAIEALDLLGDAAYAISCWLFPNSCRLGCFPGKVWTTSDIVSEYPPIPTVAGSYQDFMCKALFADTTIFANKCVSPGQNEAMGYNLYVALLTQAWNQAATGTLVDCFVPLVADVTKNPLPPLTPWAPPSQTEWTNAQGQNFPASLDVYPNAGLFPFLYVDQASFAFLPMTQVPLGVLVPGFPQGAPGFGLADIAGTSDITDAEYVGGPYTANTTYSTIQAKNGIIVPTAAKIAIAAVAAAAIPAVWALVQKRSVLATYGMIGRKIGGAFRG
jgi:hypothetical protein